MGTARCAAHARPYDEVRGSARARGYTARWDRYRESWLLRHPRCGDRMHGPSVQHSACARAGRVTPATDVDHIIPATGPDDPAFFDGANHQSLCHRCHSAKTARERGGHAA